MSRRILVVEDETPIRDMITFVLRDRSARLRTGNKESD